MADGHEVPKRLFHVFISYRVRTDAQLAELLAAHLSSKFIGVRGNHSGLQIKCFLDKLCLVDGEDWEEGFLNGLRSSMLFVPLISEAGLANFHNITGPDGPQDNVLLEYERALAMREAGDLEILPCLVGTTEGRAYHRFGAWGPYPDVVSPSSTHGRTVADTMRELFKIQSLFVNPSELAKATVPSIVSRLDNYVWPRYKALWHDASALGPEVLHKCVQCLETYRESENVHGACEYNTQNPWQNSAPKTTAQGRHRRWPHRDYDYTQYGLWYVATIGWRSNDVDTWLEVDVPDFHPKQAEDDTPWTAETIFTDSGVTRVSARVGVIGSGECKGMLFVVLGGCSGTLHLFHTDDLDDVQRMGWTNIGTLTVRTQDHLETSVTASWLWDDAESRITGIKLSVLRIHTPEPLEYLLPFTWDKLGVIQVDRDAFVVPDAFAVPDVPDNWHPRVSGRPLSTRIYTAGPSLPATYASLEDMDDVTPLSKRPTIHTDPTGAAGGDLSVRLRVADDSVCAEAAYSSNCDSVFVPVMLLNLDEERKHTIIDAHARWRHIASPGQDPEPWQELRNDGSTSGVFVHPGDRSVPAGQQTEIPFTLAADDVTTIALHIRIPSESKQRANCRQYGLLWEARFRCIEIEVAFESKFGSRAAIVIPAGNPPDRSSRAKAPEDPNVLLWIHADNIDTWDSQVAQVTLDGSKVATRVLGYAPSIDVEDAQRLVYLASLIQQPVIRIISSSASRCEGHAYALIDLEAQRLAGIRAVIRTAYATTVGEVVLPLYSQSQGFDVAPEWQGADDADPEPSIPDDIAPLLEITPWQLSLERDGMPGVPLEPAPVRCQRLIQGASNVHHAAASSSAPSTGTPPATCGGAGTSDVHVVHLGDTADLSRKLDAILAHLSQ